MSFAFTPGLPPSIATIPRDVLSHIALDTVYISSSPPTLRDLVTIRSLVLTSRAINQKLSLKRNPHLYASILRLMCNIDPVERRLGARAVVASALASELPRRFNMLKRVRERLRSLREDGEDRHASSIDLVTLYLMMSENDGNNRHQLLDILGTSGLSDLCFNLLSGGGQPREGGIYIPDIGLVMALMWMNSQDAIAYEDPERSTEIFDLLQPLLLGNTEYGRSTAEFQYFGIQCTFSLPSPIPFARLCTVERYDAVRRQQNTGSGRSCTRPAWDWSARFDGDFMRSIRVSSILPAGGRIIPLPLNSHTGSPFEGTWEGAWCLPCPVNSAEVVMCYRPMQCQLREYICTSAENLVDLVDAGNDDEDELARAWFAEDVEIKETTTSLRIYDPTTALWVSYAPRFELTEPTAVFDTILFGETEPVHGAEFGDFKFHGRVRQADGRVALLRQPADPSMDDLGIWVFHGQIYGQFDLVGEWTNTSTAKDTPAGHGWFRMAKDATDLVL